MATKKNDGGADFVPEGGGSRFDIWFAIGWCEGTIVNMVTWPFRLIFGKR